MNQVFLVTFIETDDLQIYGLCLGVCARESYVCSFVLKMASFVCAGGQCVLLRIDMYMYAVTSDYENKTYDDSTHRVVFFTCSEIIQLTSVATKFSTKQ